MTRSMSLPDAAEIVRSGGKIAPGVVIYAVPGVIERRGAIDADEKVINDAIGVTRDDWRVRHGDGKYNYEVEVPAV